MPSVHFPPAGLAAAYSPARADHYVIKRSERVRHQSSNLGQHVHAHAVQELYTAELRRKRRASWTVLCALGGLGGERLLDTTLPRDLRQTVGVYLGGALGLPVGGGAWSVAAGGPSNSVKMGLRPSAHT
jgi:hypothetical protein